MAEGSAWSLPISILALGISFLGYRRGGLRVAIHVAFDQAPPPGEIMPGYALKVDLWNVGGRPAYISTVYVIDEIWGVPVPLGHAAPGAGDIIPVGGAPSIYMATQVPWEAYLADKWWRFRVVAEGEGGRRWKSGWLVRRPSFATADPPALWPFVARLWNTALHLI